MTGNSAATGDWRLKAASFVCLGLFLLFATPATVLGQVRLASRFGEANIGGRRAIVHVTVAVPRGADANTVADDAVRGQGARPFGPLEFSLTGLVWNQFFDGNPGNDVVAQYYNASGEPAGLNAVASLQSSQITWGGVTTSRVTFQDGGNTSRCPSLVRECSGPQTFDNFNDVGWLAIPGCCTLGVTWSDAGGQEADMALNTRFPWSTTGGDVDVETIFLHENGHVVGLGHSSVVGSVMEPTYAGQRRALTLDDERGVTYLYPEAGTVGSIGGTVTSGGNPVRRAKVTIAGFPISATTDGAGNYTLANVPNLGTYSLSVSAKRYISQTVSDVHVGDDVDFVLEQGR
jgi:hypothetical protein